MVLVDWLPLRTDLFLLLLGLRELARDSISDAFSAGMSLQTVLRASRLKLPEDETEARVSRDEAGEDNLFRAFQDEANRVRED